MNKQSLKYRWLRLSTLIISVTYLIFSSLLIYFTSMYLKDQEYRSVDRSLEELESLYESQPINTISQNEIYSSLYDRQKMILYTQSGEEVFSATTGIPMDLDSSFDMTGEPFRLGLVLLVALSALLLPYGFLVGLAGGTALFYAGRNRSWLRIGGRPRD